MLKVLYMTNSALPNLALLNHLQVSKIVEVCGVIEEITGRTERASQLFKKKSFSRRLDIVAFRLLQRLIPDKSGYSADEVIAGDIPRLTASNINDQKVISFIGELAPDLILLKGVSIISREIIEAAGGNIVNIHSGWLPDYRGVQCGTWPLVNNEFDRVGITFHFVDEGLDTGNIILRKVLDKETLLNTGLLSFHHQIGYQQYSLIAKNLGQFFEAYQTNTFTVIPQPSKPARPYSFLGLSDYIKATLNLYRYKKQAQAD